MALPFGVAGHGKRQKIRLPHFPQFPPLLLLPSLLTPKLDSFQYFWGGGGSALLLPFLTQHSESALLFHLGPGIPTDCFNSETSHSPPPNGGLWRAPLPRVTVLAPPEDPRLGAKGPLPASSSPVSQGPGWAGWPCRWLPWALWSRQPRAQPHMPCAWRSLVCCATESTPASLRDANPWARPRPLQVSAPKRSSSPQQEPPSNQLTPDGWCPGDFSWCGRSPPVRLLSVLRGVALNVPPSAAPPGLAALPRKPGLLPRGRALPCPPVPAELPASLSLCRSLRLPPASLPATPLSRPSPAPAPLQIANPAADVHGGGRRLSLPFHPPGGV